MMISRSDIRVFQDTARGFEYPPASDEQLRAVGLVSLSQLEEVRDRIAALDLQHDETRGYRQHAEQQVDELKSLLRRALADFWEEDSSWIQEAHVALGDVRLTRYERALHAAALASKVADERQQALSKAQAERDELLAFVQRNYRRIFDSLHGEGYGGERTLPGQLSLASDMKRLLEWRAAELSASPDGRCSYCRDRQVPQCPHQAELQDSSDRAQVAEDQTPLPVESAAADPARAHAEPDAQGSAGSGGEVDEWAKRAAGFITDGPDKLTPEQISTMISPDEAPVAGEGNHDKTQAGDRQADGATGAPSLPWQHRGSGVASEPWVPKIGDTVRLVQSKHNHPSWVGKTGEVVDVDGQRRARLNIVGRLVWFTLDLIEPAPPEERAGYKEGRLTSLLKTCREQCESAERASGEPYKSHFTILAIENLARAVEVLAGRKESAK